MPLSLMLCNFDHVLVGIESGEAINAQEVDISLLICHHLFDPELDQYRLNLG